MAKKEQRGIAEIEFFFGEDPWAYYQEHYSGLGRTELQKANRPLYYSLKDSGDLERIPQKKAGKKAREFGGSPWAYYQEHHSGLGRTELHRANLPLYKRLRDSGDLEKIPTKRRGRERKDFGEDPWAYYQEHHYGLSRKELNQVNRSLFRRLRDNGDLEKIPKKKGKPQKTKAHSGAISIHAPRGSNQVTLEHFLADENSPSPEEAVTQKEMYQRMEQALANLSKEEHSAVVQHFGLVPKAKNDTQTDISILNRALSNLREAFL